MMPHVRKAEKRESTLIRNTKRRVEGSLKESDDELVGEEAALVSEGVDVDDIALVTAATELAWLKRLLCTPF